MPCPSARRKDATARFLGCEDGKQHLKTGRKKCNNTYKAITSVKNELQLRHQLKTGNGLFKKETPVQTGESENRDSDMKSTKGQ